MNRTSFLNQLAQLILSEHEINLHKVVIVLPTKRAGLFLKKALAEESQKSLLAPKIITLDELVETFSGVKAISNRKLLFEFYQVYNEIENEKADSFDKFLKWAPQLLSDYNDINRYMLNPKSVFTDLRNLKELDLTFAMEENLSQMQERFLLFWDKIGIWYQALEEHLCRKQMLSTGMAYRKAALQTEKAIESFDGEHMYIAGFNALSASENTILKAVSESSRGTVLWDYDNYYTTDNSIHEAGYFYRQNRERIPSGKFIKESNFEKISKITHTPCPSSISQTLQLAYLLEEQDNLNEHTAIVLADEKLLPALLNALPEKVDKLNITMGYKLKQTASYNLIKQILEIQKKNERQGTEKLLVYHKDLVALLQHPLISNLFRILDPEYDVRWILRRLSERNRIFVGENFIKQQFNDKTQPLLLDLLQPFTNAGEFTSRVNKIILQVIQLNQTHEFASVLEKAALYKLVSVFNALDEQLSSLPFEVNAKAFWRLLIGDIAKETIDLYGEPFGGIQVMGVLETRALDFDRIYLLSANEDVLPGQNREVSFLPYEVKKFHGLPTYKERDAVYAYHFYRLLQRCGRADLFSAQTENGETKEQSRFITQLEFEFSRIEKNNPIRSFEAEKTKEISFDGNSFVQHFKELAAQGISPSAINKWLNCPLDFMYQYLLGLREDEDEVEETMEHSTFGSLVHSSLEFFYEEFVGQNLSVDKLQAKKIHMAEYVKKAMLKYYESDDIDKGLNFLNRKVIEKMCLKFVDFDCKKIDENGSTTLLKLEEILKIELPFLSEIIEQIVLKGFADRVEQNQGLIKILDYKTGKVDTKKLVLSPEDFDDIEALRKKEKALQLLFYAVVYNLCHPENSLNISTGIIPIKQLSQGELTLTFNGKTVLDKNDLKEAEELMLSLLTRLFDTNQQFSHRVKAKYCQYC